jgi:hypothetical protein
LEVVVVVLAVGVFFDKPESQNDIYRVVGGEVEKKLRMPESKGLADSDRAKARGLRVNWRQYLQSAAPNLFQLPVEHEGTQPRSS